MEIILLGFASSAQPTLLFEQTCDENNKVIYKESRTRGFLYRLTKEVASRAGVPNYFSPEYCFALDFTLNYNEFAFYFPVLGRLREFSNVLVLVGIMNNVRTSNQENAKNIQEKLDDEPYWQEERTQIEEEVKRITTHYDQQYQDKHREMDTELAQKFVLNKQKMDRQTIYQNQQQRLQHARQQMGSLTFNADSPEIQRVIQEKIADLYRDAASQGFSSYDSQVQNVKYKIESQASDLADQLSQQTRALYREKLMGDLSPTLSKHFSSRQYEQYIDDFLDDNLLSLANALTECQYQDLKAQLQSAYSGVATSTIDQALQGNATARQTIVDHVLIPLRQELESVKKRQIAEAWGPYQKSHGALEDALAKTKRMEADFVKLGLSTQDNEPNLDQACLWVPANIYREEKAGHLRLVYGGVSLLPKVNPLDSNHPDNIRFVQAIFYAEKQQEIQTQHFETMRRLNAEANQAQAENVLLQQRFFKARTNRMNVTRPYVEMDPVFRAAEFYKKSRGETGQSAPSASEKQTHPRQAAAGGGGKRPPSPPDREGGQAGNDPRWQQATSATSSSTAEAASSSTRARSPLFEERQRRERRGVVNLSVDASLLRRTHAISGRASSRIVNNIANDMKRGNYEGPPIDVVQGENGDMYIVDGHHRAAAARITGTKVKLNVIHDIQNHPSGYKSIEEVINDSFSVRRDRLRPMK